MQFADNTGPDQPAYSYRSLLTELMDTVVYVDEKRMSISDCMNAHAHLGLRCSHVALGPFSSQTKTGSSENETFITKTCLYNFDPLKPHFYIVKLGFTGVHIIFLFLLKNIECGYFLEPPRRGGSNEYPQSMF